MAAANSVTNKAGRVISNTELQISAAAYNANPNEQTARAHDRALVNALISSGDVSPNTYSAG